MSDFKLDLSEVEQWFKSKANRTYTKQKQNLLQRLTTQVLRVAKSAENTPADTSALRSSIKSEIINENKARVYTNIPYASFVEKGTGIYGDHKSPIVPKSKPFLVFKSKKLGRIIRAKSVRGMKGRHFMQNAYNKVREKAEGLKEAATEIINEIKK